MLSLIKNEVAFYETFSRADTIISNRPVIGVLVPQRLHLTQNEKHFQFYIMLIKGVLSRRFRCILVKATQKFNIEPFL